MGQFLFYYVRPEPATWVYMSTFLAIGLYFMFVRVWSLRNLDVVLLLLLTPGLMMVYEGRKARLDAAAVTTTSLPPGLAQMSDQTESPERLVATSAPQNDLSGVLPQADSPRVASDPPTVDPNDLNSENSESAAVETGGKRKYASWTPSQLQYFGFMWLLVVTGLLIIRMLLDTSLVRRPMLEPNLSIGGLTFLGVSLFLFLMANILTSTPREQTQSGMRMGPGYVLLNKLPDITTTPRVIADMRRESALLENVVEPVTDTSPIDSAEIESPAARRSTMIARIVAIVANLTIVAGIIAIGGWHFGNLKTGVGVAVFCILLPYASQTCGRLDHVLPAAALVLAILAYRNPILSGLCVGSAAGLVYFPFFLLPLWMSFYWQRGLKRFCLGLAISLGAMAISTVVLADENAVDELRRMFGLFPIASQNLGGVWGLGWHPYFRLPVLVGFGLLSFSFTLWPAQKNLATLLSCSAAIMMAAQFGHGYGGGLFMAWFLPLATLSIFRPNLDDRIAIRMVRLWGHKPKVVARDDDDDANELAIAS